MNTRQSVICYADGRAFYSPDHVDVATEKELQRVVDAGSKWPIMGLEKAKWMVNHDCPVRCLPIASIQRLADDALQEDAGDLRRSFRCVIDDETGRLRGGVLAEIADAVEATERETLRVLAAKYPDAVQS